MCWDITRWELIFQELIEQEKPWAKWTLKLDKNIQPDQMAPGWKQFQQKAFGRFLCSLCQRSWASSQVKILCHMYWDHGMSQGQVLMRLFSQRCQKCPWSQFEKPEFSEDNIKRILHNLAQYILQRYYGHGFRRMTTIREIPLDGPHDTGNCEACTLGFCARNSQTGVVTPSKLPSPFPKNQDSSPRCGDVLGVRSSQRHREPPKSLPSSSSLKTENSYLYSSNVLEEPRGPSSPGELIFLVFMVIFAIILGQIRQM